MTFYRQCNTITVQEAIHAARGLTTFVALCSVVLGKPVQGQVVVLGSKTLGGSKNPSNASLNRLRSPTAEALLLPIPTTASTVIHNELVANVQTKFYFHPGTQRLRPWG